MPEGDTVWRTARRLHEALAGRVIEHAELRWPSLAAADLRGMTTLEVRSRGKHLLHRLDSGLTLHSHLRMEGQWRIEASNAVPQRFLHDHRLRALVTTEAWTALGLRLGMLDLVSTSEEHTLVGHLGPDVLGPDWDADEAVARLRASGTSIGAAILDQRNLAGVGTMYAAEGLFLERLHPWSPASHLADPVLEQLVTRLHTVLHRGRESVDQSTTGSHRRGETHYVHARSGLPCRRCGDGIRVSPIGPPGQQRTMFSCPTCQGGIGPDDDGRPQRPMGSSAGRRGPRKP